MYMSVTSICADKKWISVYVTLWLVFQNIRSLMYVYSPFGHSIKIPLSQNADKVKRCRKHFSVSLISFNSTLSLMFPQSQSMLLLHILCFLKSSLAFLHSSVQIGGPLLCIVQLISALHSSFQSSWSCLQVGSFVQASISHLQLNCCPFALIKKHAMKVIYSYY